MPGLDADAPTTPFGGLEEVAVSPDGAEVIFAAKILPGSEAAWSTDYDLYAISATVPGEPRCLTEANQAYDNGPVYSPDGKTLAWLAMARPGYEADRQHVVLMDVASGAQRQPRPRPRRPRRSAPAASLWDAQAARPCTARAAYLGQTSLFAIDVQKGTSRLVVRDGSNGSVTWAGDRLLYLKNTLRSPDEIFTVKADGKDEKQITDLNGACLAQGPDGRDRAVHLPGLERRDGVRLRRQAVRLHPRGRGRRPQVAPRLPGPRRPAGQLRQRLPLPLEPAGLRRRRLRHRRRRLPRLHRLRPGVHRRHQPPLGRPSARGPREGPRRGAREVPLAGRHARWSPPAPATAAT